MNMRVLLTGGSGMVGRNFVEKIDVHEIDVVAPRRRDLDLRDYAQTLRYIRQERPDLIIHAAGRVGGIQANIANPTAFLVENLDLGRNIILAAREANVKRFLNLGSSCMYPRAAVNPLREEMLLTGELEPTNEGYALAKIATARLCEYVSREDPTFQYKTAIPCNLYGRWDKFDDSARSHLVAAIVQKIDAAVRRCDRSVEIWGDGNARREFMYAGDFGEFLAAAIERFDSLPQYMNVGVGQDRSINEYYRVIAEVIGYEGGFEHDVTKPVGMERKLLDVSRQKEWGWMPRTSLHDGIRRTHEFYANRASDHVPVSQ